MTARHMSKMWLFLSKHRQCSNPIMNKTSVTTIEKTKAWIPSHIPKQETTKCHKSLSSEDRV